MTHHRIGMIVPSSNTTMETEVPAFMREFAGAQATLSFHSARVRMKHVTQSELEAMNASASEAMSALCDAPVEAVGYACLVAIMAMGNGYHRQAEATLAELGDRAVITSAGALVDELNASGAKRVAIVMPYADGLARRVVEYIEAEGITVQTYRNLSVTDNVAVGRIAPETVMEAASSLHLAGTDALVLSACVQMPSLTAIAAARNTFDVPVLSASLCTARRLWQAVASAEAQRQAAA